MCRKHHRNGCCLLCLGTGMILGYCLESWVLSCCGGVGLCILGLWVLQQK